MNALDWTILGILVFSALVAAGQGFFFEIVSLAGAVVGYLAAAWGRGKIAPWFLPYVKSQAFAELAGFLTIFLAVVLVAGAVARIVRWMIHSAGLRGVDRLMGAAFGFLRGAVVVTAGVLAITAFAPESQELAGSRLAGYFMAASRGASWLAPSDLRQRFGEGVNKIRQGLGSGMTGSK